jgi:hypothetical protein
MGPSYPQAASGENYSDSIRGAIESACRHLLSEQSRDPYALTYGCFDRRYWGWKLVDYPEATYQRNVYPLAWLARQVKTSQPEYAQVLNQSAISGLLYAVKIQHRDGSFDQAFPNEHSFGATAFLLDSLIKAYQLVRWEVTAAERKTLERSLYRAGEFLCRHEEKHGFIANHLAGASLALYEAANYFSEARFENQANNLLKRILENQSTEGWFTEYDGADPGYQTLCMYYLAQVYALRPGEELKEALGKSLEFLAWFVHPDGTFGGEYGSRRTAVYYPGGMALLGQIFPLALSMTRFMSGSIGEGKTITLDDVDMGNMAPLLSNMISLLNAEVDKKESPLLPLPWQMENAQVGFPKAGLYARRYQQYYTIVGASNGGVIKVFDVTKRLILWNDGGYVGQTSRGRYLTTQMTDLERSAILTPDALEIQTPFYIASREMPTPFRFVLLRLLNLTVMSSLWLGNLIKSILVNMLITQKRAAPLHLTRRVDFASGFVTISDKIQIVGKIKLKRLEYGSPYVAIHMASAGYFEGAQMDTNPPLPRRLDVSRLQATGEIQAEVVVA